MKFISSKTKTGVVRLLVATCLGLTAGCSQLPITNASRTARSETAQSETEQQPDMQPPQLSQAEQVAEAEAIRRFDDRRLQVQMDAARTRLRVGDFKGAELLLRRVVQRHPAEPTARRLLAELLSATGRQKEAEQHLRIQLESFPNDAAGHHELALLLEISGRAAAAQHHFRRARDLEPSNTLYQMTCQ